MESASAVGAASASATHAVGGWSVKITDAMDRYVDFRNDFLGLGCFWIIKIVVCRGAISHECSPPRLEQGTI